MTGDVAVAALTGAGSDIDLDVFTEAEEAAAAAANAALIAGGTGIVIFGGMGSDAYAGGFEAAVLEPSLFKEGT